MIPEFVKQMWMANAYNEMYPDHPMQTVLLTSSDLKWLESNSTPMKKEKPIVSKPLRIQNVGSKVLYF